MLVASGQVSESAPRKQKVTMGGAGDLAWFALLSAEVHVDGDPRHDGVHNRARSSDSNLDRRLLCRTWKSAPLNMVDASWSGPSDLDHPWTTRARCHAH